MPIKSKAQRRKFAELLMKGEITPDAYERWNRGAGYKELPERVTPKKKSKARRTSKAAPKRKAAAKTKAKGKKKTTSARKTTKRARR